MKKETRKLLEKSINSLILSMEHFNRPWDRGRKEAVLILLDHSFELLLKAALIHVGEKIRRKGELNTIGFEACVNKSLSSKIITNDQAITLRTINSLRDACQHYMVDISEQYLYLNTQAGLTLYQQVLKDTLKKNIAKELPKRVLPVSTMPPLEIDVMFENEVKEIKKLLKPGSRRKMEAITKLRGLTILDRVMNDDNLQPSDNYLNNLAEQIKDGKDWKTIFPGVASVNISSNGVGPELKMHITRNEGIPIHKVPEGTPGVPIIEKRVNELSFYSFSPKQLAHKVGLTIPKLNAVIKHLNLREDDSCYKLIEFSKSSSHHCYSPKAISKIKNALKKEDIDEIWIKNRPDIYNQMGERKKNVKSKRRTGRKRNFRTSK